MNDLNTRTTIHDLLTAHPFLIDELPAAYPKFAPLRNPALRSTMGRVATIARAAEMAGVPADKLLADIGDMIRRHASTTSSASGAMPAVTQAAKLQALKSIIRRLHDGAPLEEARRDFETSVGDASPQEIAEMEQALIREGMPVQEIRRLCDVHVGVVCGSLNTQAAPSVPAGHPVHTYMAENRAIEQAAARWTTLCKQLFPVPDAAELASALDTLAQVEIHYTRKENQLFPALERHGFTGPSTVMWAVHDDIRARIKAARQAVGQEDRTALAAIGPELAGHITSMIYKEERILFPTALSMLSEEEWAKIRAGDDAIGYALVKPAADWGRGSAPARTAPPADPSLVRLATGALTPEQLSCMLTSLPVEISFVDENDRVQFYSDHSHRIFPRSPEVIGRAVQNCHPQKSVHMVDAILKAFRDGTREEASFWIEFKGRFILISYYPVRSGEGKYLGCIEVTQDITAIRGLQGEKRLLDWT